ncbi:MAG: hypothetical protein MJ078_05935, partial [Clostridia bacterium]|nr:hypothetical protein [Clostridia bacterium]
TAAARSLPAGFVSAVQAIPTPKQEQTKTVKISQNGTTTIFPDTGKVLSGATVNVNVQGGGGKNKQFCHVCAILESNSYSDLGISIQVTKTGTYKAQWFAERNYSGDSGATRLYINNSAYGSEYKTFGDPDKWTMRPSVTGISLTAGSTIAVRGKLTSGDIYVFGLYIEEE